MKSIRKADEKIICLRNKLHRLIENSTSLSDPEMIHISQFLDDALNEFNKRKKIYGGK